MSASTQRFSRQRSHASDQVALEIRRYLERQELRPGDRIGTEAELAAEFGVSRPTLREGLRLLASSHLIRVVAGRNGGVFVANTPNEGMGRTLSESIAMMVASETVSLHELIEARIFLEVPLAGRAAERSERDLVDDLNAAIEAAEGAEPGHVAFDDADAQFHRLIAAAAGNELMVGFTSWTLDVLQPLLIEQLARRVDGASILAQHQEIARAIGRGRPRAAEAAMRRHLDYLLDVTS